MDLLQWIDERKHAMRLSLRKFAPVIHMSAPSLSRLLTGQREPSYSDLGRLVDAFEDADCGEIRAAWRRSRESRRDRGAA